MKLEFVEIAGFRGFRELVSFDFPPSYSVLTGRNGSGKSTILDAVEFAITGTISKFQVTEARGGGLEAHIWWVRKPPAAEHYVRVGFINGAGERFIINRSRARGCDIEPGVIMQHFTNKAVDDVSFLETLIKTTLIRDEQIAAFSLDLPEQARFAAVRAAIGVLVGPDYSDRTKAILEAANAAKNRQAERVNRAQTELGRLLGELTEARSLAERSSSVSDALQAIDSIKPSLPIQLSDRIEALRKLIADRQVVLREIEQACGIAEELLPEIDYFESEAGQRDVQNAREAEASTLKNNVSAAKALAATLTSQKAEKQTDEYVTHLEALSEHGSALGLQAGHCPLCDAVRSVEEFNDALASVRAKLAEQGKKLATFRDEIELARDAVIAASELHKTAQATNQALENRRLFVEKNLQQVQAIYAHHQFEASAKDPGSAKVMLLTEQERLIRFERALSILENSNAIERVTSLEDRIARLREVGDQEAAQVAVIEKAVDSARQIQEAAKLIHNQILTEQFDTVMPLLKELYRRLRPHTDWTEIESDFGGKVRASLNFTVEGHNPQFLFSSGQRRAAGLAFLLAMHLSRPWCTWQSLLLDDPVQHIDDYRALNLVEVLSAIRRTDRQVIIAVEDPSLADVLCRRLGSTRQEIGRQFELQISNTGSAEIASQRDIYPMPQLVLRPAQAS